MFSPSSLSRSAHFAPRIRRHSSFCFFVEVMKSWSQRRASQPLLWDKASPALNYRASVLSLSLHTSTFVHPGSFVKLQGLISSRGGGSSNEGENNYAFIRRPIIGLSCFFFLEMKKQAVAVGMEQIEACRFGKRSRSGASVKRLLSSECACRVGEANIPQLIVNSAAERGSTLRSLTHICM